MKKVLAFLLTVILITGLMGSALAAGYNIDTAKSSIVRIHTIFVVDDVLLSNTPFFGVTGHAYGSGFAIGELDKDTVEYIVTAGHVLMHHLDYGDMRETSTDIDLDGDGKIDGYFHVQVIEIQVLINDASSFVLAHDAGVSDRADVAVLRLNNPINQRKAAVLLDEKNFSTNTPLTSMGFPAASEVNLSATASSEYISTTDAVTTNHGFFSRFTTHAVTGQGDQIQTTAEMSPGMSGGAIVDDNGYVVGVATKIATLTDNVNYGSATSEIIRLLNSLTDCHYVIGPVKTVPDTLTIILIAAGALAVILLTVLIIASSKANKNKRVLVFGGVMGGKTYQLKPGAPLVIGRDPNSCKVIYPNNTPGVSHTHCTITYDGKQVLVADNGSSYGTFVGGVKVEPGRPMVMHRGQVVTFGSDKNPAELH